MYKLERYWYHRRPHTTKRRHRSDTDLTQIWHRGDTEVTQRWHRGVLITDYIVNTAYVFTHILVYFIILYKSIICYWPQHVDNVVIRVDIIYVYLFVLSLYSSSHYMLVVMTSLGCSCPLTVYYAPYSGYNITL